MQGAQGEWVECRGEPYIHYAAASKVWACYEGFPLPSGKARLLKSKGLSLASPCFHSGDCNGRVRCSTNSSSGSTSLDDAPNCSNLRAAVKGPLHRVPMTPIFVFNVRASTIP